MALLFLTELKIGRKAYWASHGLWSAFFLVFKIEEISKITPCTPCNYLFTFQCFESPKNVVDSTYQYLDFHLLCSMTKLKEHSTEICYKERSIKSTRGDLYQHILEHRASWVKESLLSFTEKTQIILRQPQPDDERGGTAAGNSAREIENLITRWGKWSNLELKV